MAAPLSIAVFSDVICPWCFLGKRRLERALDDLGLRGTTTIQWLPFELNPAMPAEGMTRADYRVQKFGAERAATLDAEMTERGRAEGIGFAFDRIGRTPNTRKAHILIAHAARHGIGGAAAEALFRGYFEQALDIGNDEVLLGIAAGIGLDRAGTRAAFDDSALDAAVADLAEEGRRLGVEGVPFFILNEAFAVSGAQPSEAWIEALRGILDQPAEVHAS
jgi:predicted DsbA family dithiol-disulfide isomerase